MARKYRKLTENELAGRMFQKSVSEFSEIHPLAPPLLVLVHLKRGRFPLYVGRIVEVLEAVARPAYLSDFDRFAYTVERPDGSFEQIEAGRAEPASDVKWEDLELEQSMLAMRRIKQSVQAERNAKAFRDGKNIAQSQSVGWLQRAEDILILGPDGTA